MTVLSGYTERVEASYPVLGRLLWFSVSEPRIAFDDLFKRLNDIGLSVGFLPPRTRGVDAFRNATKSAWRKRVKDGEITENYMLREVVCDDEHVVQHVMRETVNARNERLSYDQVGTATFHRPSEGHPHGRVIVENQAPFFDTRLVNIVNEIAAKIHDEFTDRVKYLHANAIRGVVRRVLESVNAVSVRPSGGVFFSPESNRSTIEKLVTLMNSFSGECHMHSLPLVDAADQREMLMSAFENESVTEIERMMDDLADLLKSGKKITVARADEFVSQYRRITAKAQDYRNVLDSQLERTTMSLETFNAQIEKLLVGVEDE